MPKSAVSIKWDFTLLNIGMKALPLLLAAHMDEVADDIADELQEYMQDNAPWEDQTGDARDGLTAEARRERKNIVIALFHTVDYGIWLEIRWSGEYAIIVPTIESQGHEAMARFKGIIGEL